MSFSPASVYARAQAGKKVSAEEFLQLVAYYSEALDYIDLLPVSIQLNGKPMDVKKRRPMFAPLFRKKRRSKREIYKCGRQVAKTTSAAASMMMNLIWREYFRIMYVAPLAIYTQRLHQVHFNPFIKNCPLPWPLQDQDCINNVMSKSFVSHSHFHAASCFNTAGNAIGVAIDWVVMDEIQDLNIEFIPQIRETLKTSDFRWESMFGTARGVENTIQVLFDESSGGEWFIKCICGLWVEPTLEKHAISMIQKHGVACPKCKRLLDFESGEWVHRYPERIGEFAGYHVPATIVRDVCTPYDRYLDTIYNKLYGISRYSEAKFLQEILGISSDQGGRPITPEEIRKASVLRFPAHGPNLDEYLAITGGADWGGSEIVSFTVGTVVGYHNTGKFHVLGAVRPMGVPDNERHLPLAAFFQKTGGRRIQGIAADAGFVGSVQNRNLEKISNIATASIAYGTKRFFFQALQGRNFIVDRTTLIYLVYALIREGHLLLPEGTEFEQFSNDLTATFIEDIEAPNGATSRRYCRYKQRADDFLHALGYAVFLCAIVHGIDLPAMLGLGPKASLNGRFADMSGEEGDAVFNLWNH